jgi:hypothetical protein
MAPLNACFTLLFQHPFLNWERRPVQQYALAGADVALMVRAVEAVDFIRWMPAQRHFGLKGGGPGVRATLYKLACAHHPLPACAAGVGEALICSLTWSQKCAHDLSMSWWRHLWHHVGMPVPQSPSLNS